MKSGPKAADLKYSAVKAGAVYSFERRITQKDVRVFARVSGDFNPLHIDSRFARSKKFSNNVAHGMLLAGFFSRLVGMMCPGKDCLFLSQTLEFRKPVFPGDVIKVQGTVKAKSDATQIITLEMEILVKGQKAVTGEAKARFMNGDKNE